MKIFRAEIFIDTKGFCDLRDITDMVWEKLKESEIKDGWLTVSIAGSTGAILTMEYDPALVEDFKEFLDRIIPQYETYKHNRTWGDGNGFSHLRSSLFQSTLVVPVDNGRMYLGNWQQIVFADFDNNERKRKLLIKIIGV